MNKRCLQILMALSIFVQALMPATAFASAPAIGTTAPAPRRPMTNAEILARVNANYAARTRGNRRINRYVSQQKIEEGLNKIRNSGEKVAVAAGQQFQTAILISILSAISIAHEKKKLQEISGVQSDGILVGAIKELPGAASALVDSPSFYSSIFGSLAAMPGNMMAKKILENILAKAGPRNVFKGLIANGAHTFISFIGWELGGQLFEEAAELIENDADYEVAHHSGKLVASVVSGRAGANDRRVFGLLMSNMSKIILYDSNLRELWLYNTWRNRIATGEFASIVGSMAAASAIGTAVFPGAGTVVGMGFGLVGGLFAMFVIPEENKNTLTAFFRDLRKGFWMMFDDKGAFPKLMGSNIKETYISILYNCISTNQPCPPVLLDQARGFGSNMRATERYISIQFEEFMFYEKQIEDAKAKRFLAEKGGNTAAVTEYTGKLRRLGNTYRRKLVELKNMYGEERSQMDTLMRQYPMRVEWTARYPQIRAIFNFHRKVRVMERILTAYSTTASQEIFADKKTYLPALYKIYFMGFSERLLLESVAQN